jgi:chain length determinant protein EpsF
MTLQQFLLILRARKKVIFRILALVVVTALAISLLLPKTYKASVSVVVDVKSPDPLMGAMLPAQLLPGYMATQVDIINSDRVAQKVVTLLKMDQSPEIQQQWRENTGGRGSLTVWLGELLGKKLDVRPSRESNVVEIGFKGSEPAFAASVANAFAEAYIDTNLELKVEPAKQYAQWFNKRVQSLRQNLETAQHKLSDYQQEHGIVATDDRLDMEIARLSDLNTQLAVAQSQRVDTSSRQSQAGSSAESMPEVLQNPLIANLKADVARQEALVGQIASRLGENHPDYINAEAQLKMMQQHVSQEIQRVVRSIGTVGRVNVVRESDLQAAVEAQKTRILDLRAQRDQIAVLQRDVESAQSAYDLVTQRLAQANLESQSQQTNIAVLTKATPPLKPSSPNILLNTLIAIVLGTLLGVGIALLMELIDQRVRSVEDLMQLAGLPVLGVIPERASTRTSSRNIPRPQYVAG